MSHSKKTVPPPSGVQDQLQSIMFSRWNQRAVVAQIQSSTSFVNNIPFRVRADFRVWYFNYWTLMLSPAWQKMSMRAWFPSIYDAEAVYDRYKATKERPLYLQEDIRCTIQLYSWMAPLHNLIRKEFRNIRRLSVFQRLIRKWLDA